jgi:hypothetical protein
VSAAQQQTPCQATSQVVWSRQTRRPDGLFPATQDVSLLVRPDWQLFVSSKSTAVARTIASPSGSAR